MRGIGERRGKAVDASRGGETTRMRRAEAGRDGPVVDAAPGLWK